MQLKFFKPTSRTSSPPVIVVTSTSVNAFFDAEKASVEFSLNPGNRFEPADTCVDIQKIEVTFKESTGSSSGIDKLVLDRFHIPDVGTNNPPIDFGAEDDLRAEPRPAM